MMAKRQRDETPVGFHPKRGRYVQLSSDNLTAKRDGDTYDHGVCFSQKPLVIGDVFQLRIEEMDLKWAGSLVSRHRRTYVGGQDVIKAKRRRIKNVAGFLLHLLTIFRVSVIQRLISDFEFALIWADCVP